MVDTHWRSKVLARRRGRGPARAQPAWRRNRPTHSSQQPALALAWPSAYRVTCSSSSTRAIVTRAVMKPRHSRSKLAAVSSAVPGRSFSSDGPNQECTLVGCRAFSGSARCRCSSLQYRPLRPGNGVGLRAGARRRWAQRTIVLRRRGGGWWLGAGLRAARLRRPDAPEPDGQQRQRHEQQQVFHGARPRTTSSTKREPT